MLCSWCDSLAVVRFHFVWSKAKHKEIACMIHARQFIDNIDLTTLENVAK